MSHSTPSTPLSSPTSSTSSLLLTQQPTESQSLAPRLKQSTPFESHFPYALTTPTSQNSLTPLQSKSTVTAYYSKESIEQRLHERYPNGLDSTQLRNEEYLRNIAQILYGKDGFSNRLLASFFKEAFPGNFSSWRTAKRSSVTTSQRVFNKLMEVFSKSSSSTPSSTTTSSPTRRPT